MGLREGDSASRDWRSKSNHRCCFNSRFRNKETRYATDSVFSSSSSSISQRKRSSTSEKASSGYGCSNPKRPRIPARSKRYSCHEKDCNYCFDVCIKVKIVLPIWELIWSLKPL
ncbi:unnamed protein product [Trichobilharzia szidati]|nr:unnamed protein product [Trichobilharzia szidati]